MYHSGKNPLRKVTYKSDAVIRVKSPEQRKLHKALLRYHDPANWEMLRGALRNMGRADLIGDGEMHLIPASQPEPGRRYHTARSKNTGQAHQRRSGGKILTQHTGLPPRETGEAKPARSTNKKPRVRGPRG
jgi:hypothetical protein